MSAKNEATEAQNRAANPANSTWVSANAGSGKTRVLTDRVARLLLQNVPPQKILCLTYTKAAAAHMQNQLFRRLGEWSMLPDRALAARLSDLGEATPPDAEILGHARTLFARALETPGGLKIQTIHSFCASLLRRFPLEAGVSPQFHEMDERTSKILRAEVLEILAGGSQSDAFDAMAAHLSGDDPDRFAAEVVTNRDRFFPARPQAEIWMQLDLPADYDTATYLATVFPDWGAGVLADLHNILLTGKDTDIKNAKILASLDIENPTMEVARALEKMFVFGPDTKRAPNMAKTSFPTKELRNSHPDLMEAVWNLMERFQDEKPRRLALLAAQKTAALHLFARAFLPEFDRRKQLHGWLDFDDLILRARDLLSVSSMAQWVLFRLDGGIDHILVDEAQDTSPAQWSVIARLAEEFSTGQSARDISRTLFVVGDEKQSIYSFQGADPNAFGEMRAHFDDRLASSGGALMKHDLLFSFRSSSAILRLVDCVLQKAGDAVGSTVANTVTHRAFFADLPGRVDLWPFLPAPEKSDKGHWFDPVDSPAPDDPALMLAGQIADAIKAVLDAGETLPTKKGNRRIVASDFLILVQRRSDLFHAIIKALKDRKLPVAGADRLKIGGELAVRDLGALLSFVATPEDDLSLASALRSPLFRLSEADIFSLAHGRKGYLWQELRARKSDFPETFAMLTDLMAQADFLRPYELLERILTRHQGREYLIARLGHEAEDGIDEMLSQALGYERTQPPSLTGFLTWMASDESDIKRQIDTDSNEIRVMTVHAAKGLESAIVILPDTAKRKPSPGSDILMLENGLAVWKTPRPDSPPDVLAALDARAAFQEAEKMRLLYVALTRAESWLIVCGAGNPGADGESWYNHVETAIGDVGAQTVDFFGRDIRRFQPFDWTLTQSAPEEQHRPPLPDVPDWCRHKTPQPEQPPEVLTPSDLGGAKIIAGATGGLDEAAALERGRRIHLLLEHLPRVVPARRRARAQALLERTDDIDDLLHEVEAVLDAPDLAALFAADTLAEVPLVASVANRPLYGVIDRLLVSADKVLAVDFKTNAAVARDVAEVPEGLLRQMGAYATALAEIYPDRVIETAILWTRTACLMPLPHKIVTDALSRATTP